MTRTRRGRPALTLIEMMVAMALTLVIMLILTESFKMSLDFVRGANSTGVLMTQLNGAGTILSRDLKAEHFLPEPAKPNNGVRLGDQRFDQNTPTPWTRPAGGFFRIESRPTGAGVPDGEGFNTHTAADHRLHFTVVLLGGNDQNLFVVNAGPAGGERTYKSRAAEVAYFLEPTGRTGPGTGGQQLYDLVRRFRLVAATDDDVSALTPATTGGTADPNPGEVISRTGAGAVNTMDTVRAAANRLSPPARIPLGSNRYGEDILASNVLSFEVLADWSGTPAPRPFNPTSGGNSDYPYDTVPNSPPYNGVFDTASTPAPQIRIKSLQVTLRLYDPKMRAARQNTWKFAM